MRIGGYGMQEHLRFLGPLFGLLAAVWVLRLVLSGAHAPIWLTMIASLTVMAPASVLLAALRIHVRHFGSYLNVVVASLLINIWAQLLIITAIAFSVLTGQENVYTAPEFSLPSDDIYHMRHIYGHFTFGIGLGSLAGAAIGCLLLWLLRKVAPVNTTESR